MPDYPGKFDYFEDDGGALAQGPCSFAFDAGVATVTPAEGQSIAFDLGDVDRITSGQWDMRLEFFTGRALALHHFAKAFDLMSRQLLEAWRGRLVQCLLLEDLEEVGRYAGTSAMGGPPVRAEIRIYKSNLASIPVEGDPLQLRLAEIGNITFDEPRYVVRIESPAGCLEIGKLAGKTEEFLGRLRAAVEALRAHSALALGNLFGFLNPDQLRRLVAAMPEGRSVPLAVLGAIHPKLPDALIDRAVGPANRPYFDALRERTSEGALMSGFKFIRPEDEEGDLSGDAETAAPDAPSGDEPSPLFFWFFFPLKTRPGVAAWEATTGSGRATYFFRLPEGGLEAGIGSLTRGLALINFRREPIYLSGEALEKQPRFRRYAIGCRRLPDLRALRSAMLGRAIHSSLESWIDQVNQFGGGGV